MKREITCPHLSPGFQSDSELILFPINFLMFLEFNTRVSKNIQCKSDGCYLRSIFPYQESNLLLTLQYLGNHCLHSLSSQIADLSPAGGSTDRAPLTWSFKFLKIKCAILTCIISEVSDQGYISQRDMVLQVIHARTMWPVLQTLVILIIGRRALQEW